MEPIDAQALKDSASRWSRDLSAKRQRELDRLNIIERGRQMLELKRQDELLKQMSFTTATIDSIVDTTTPATTITDVAPKTPSVGAYAHKTESSKEAPLQSSSCSRHTATEAEGEHFDGGKSDNNNQQARTSESEGDFRMRNSACNEPEKEKEKEQEQAQEEEIEEEDCKEGAGSGHAPLPPAGASSKQQTVDGALKLRTEHLTEFAATCVPPNKRVMCLIVRDKVSRFNQARSYFCPTYYLFIQAICDLDEAGGDISLQRGCRLPSTETMTGAGLSSDEDSIVGTSARRTHDDGRLSADNSFSASSSISADMMFIGTGLQQATIATAAPTNLAFLREQLVTDASYKVNECQPPLQQQRQQTSSESKPAGAKTNPNSKEDYNDDNDDNDDNEDDDDDDDDPEEPQQPTPGPYLDTITIHPLNEFQKVASSEENFSARSGHLVESRAPAGNLSAGPVELESKVRSRRLHESLFENELNPFTGARGVLLAGRKRKKAKTYRIGPGEQGFVKRNCVCKLKSNVLGTQFNAIRLANDQADSSFAWTIASINYETNVLGFKGPRKMRVFLLKEGEQSSRSTRNLGEIYRKETEAGWPPIVQLKNKTPSWNVESQSYVLNFHGRVTQASVKNFQLVECPDSRRKQTASHRQRANRSLSPESPLNGGRANSHKRATNRGQLSEAGTNGQANLQLTSEHPPSADSDHLARQSIDSSSIVMQFGRISSHEFTCDLTHPLSILQAFAIALSSFDSKLACE